MQKHLDKQRASLETCLAENDLPVEGWSVEGYFSGNGGTRLRYRYIHPVYGKHSRGLCEMVAKLLNARNQPEPQHDTPQHDTPQQHKPPKRRRSSINRAASAGAAAGPSTSGGADPSTSGGAGPSKAKRRTHSRAPDRANTDSDVEIVEDDDVSFERNVKSMGLLEAQAALRAAHKQADELQKHCTAQRRARDKAMEQYKDHLVRANEHARQAEALQAQVKAHLDKFKALKAVADEHKAREARACAALQEQGQKLARVNKLQQDLERRVDEHECCLCGGGEDLYQMTGCAKKHVLCINCIRHWLFNADINCRYSKLSSAPAQPCCAGCDKQGPYTGNMNDADLQRLLDDRLITAEQYQTVQAEMMRESGVKLKSCCNASCAFKFDPEPGPDGVVDKYKISCEACHTTQCYACGVDWEKHGERSCADYQAEAAAAAAPVDKETMELLKNAVPCPGTCGHTLEKDGNGCNVLRCQLCSLYVCALCGERLDSSNFRMDDPNHAEANKHFFDFPDKPCHMLLFDRDDDEDEDEDEYEDEDEGEYEDDDEEAVGGVGRAADVVVID